MESLNCDGVSIEWMAALLMAWPTALHGVVWSGSRVLGDTPAFVPSVLPCYLWSDSPAPSRMRSNESHLRREPADIKHHRLAPSGRVLAAWPKNKHGSGNLELFRDTRFEN